ncbi:MAG: hypothetical protein KJ867_15625 [Gammaproteobacteria bacterium]|nr:hypothetical protein [Gammaproteobacteria bacterium]
MRHSYGYTCLGYDNALRETRALAERLGHPDMAPSDAERGTLSVMEKRERLFSLLAASKKDLGTWYDPTTPEKVRKILETLRKRGEKVRIFYGDSESGRDWLEENDALGHIGRSTGTLKIPLLVSDVCWTVAWCGSSAPEMARRCTGTRSTTSRSLRWCSENIPRWSGSRPLQERRRGTSLGGLHDGRDLLLSERVTVWT